LLRHLLLPFPRHICHQAAQASRPMDARFGVIPVILRRHDGSSSLREAPCFNSAAAFHGRLLRISRIDVVLLHRSSKHSSHGIRGACPTGFPVMVSCELLPDGLQRTSPCQQLRCPPSSSLDDELRDERSRRVRPPRQAICPRFPRCTLCTLCKVVCFEESDCDISRLGEHPLWIIPSWHLRPGPFLHCFEPCHHGKRYLRPGLLRISRAQTLARPSGLAFSRQHPLLGWQD
jgi:hypothetical protein